jgi:hypothetical protein
MSRAKDNSRQIDRDARNRLIQSLDAFLHREIDKDTFAGKIDDIDNNSSDSTVLFGYVTFQSFCDYFQPYYANLSKCEWDYLQRIRLLLASDARVCESTRLSRREVVAATTLILAVTAGLFIGFNIYLVLLWGVVAPVSLVLGHWRNEPTPEALRLLPFASVKQLLHVRLTTPAFRKERHPADHHYFQSESAVKEAILSAQTYVFWVVFSPFALLFQMIPESTHQIVEPSGGQKHIAPG